MKFLLIICIALFSLQAFSTEEQIHNNRSYQKPTLLEPFTTMPKNFGTLFSDSFSKDKLGAWGIIAASTTMLVIYDHEVAMETQRFGRRLHIAHDDHTKRMINLGNVSIFRGPTDLGSAMYFLGDGWTTLALTTSFLAVGAYTQDYRALQTASQLFEGLLMTGIVTQTLKRSTGRESPTSATTSTGVWRPFPSFSSFQGRISKYDAFPSGHLATAIMSVAVISKNYDEYTWIAPVGYSLCGLLGFQMVNNGVHWASDYPLAIGIGYMIGSSIAKNGSKKIEDAKSSNKITYNWTPLLTAEGNLAMGLNISY